MGTLAIRRHDGVVETIGGYPSTHVASPGYLCFRDSAGTVNHVEVYDPSETVDYPSKLRFRTSTNRLLYVSRNSRYTGGTLVTTYSRSNGALFVWLSENPPRNTGTITTIHQFFLDSKANNIKVRTSLRDVPSGTVASGDWSQSMCGGNTQALAAAFIEHKGSVGTSWSFGYIAPGTPRLCFCDYSLGFGSGADMEVFRA